MIELIHRNSPHFFSKEASIELFPSSIKKKKERKKSGPRPTFLERGFPQVFEARDESPAGLRGRKRRINYAKRDSYDRYTRYIHPRRINLQPSFPIMEGPLLNPVYSVAYYIIDLRIDLCEFGTRWYLEKFVVN